MTNSKVAAVNLAMEAAGDYERAIAIANENPPFDCPVMKMADKVGFEGGQMPLHRRLPKRGFTSPFGRFTQEVRLSEIQKLPIDEIDLLALKQAGVVSELTRHVKVILSGSISRRVTLQGLGVTAGAKAAVEAAGGVVILPIPVEKVRKLPPKNKTV